MNKYQPRNRKLSAVKAREIRSKAGSGSTSAQELADLHGVDVSCIYEVLRGRSYPSRVVADVSDALMTRIEAAAAAAGVSVSELAASVLAKSFGA